MASKLSLKVGDIITLLSNNSDTTPFASFLDKLTL